MPTLTKRNYRQQPRSFRSAAYRSTDTGIIRGAASAACHELVAANAPWSEGWIKQLPHWDGSGVHWNKLIEQYIHASEVRQKLAQLRRLQKGWDSYDAQPPSAKACNLAEAIVGALQESDLSVEFLTPTSDGSILIKHFVGKAAVTWEIDDDGEIGVMIEPPDGEPLFHSPKENGIVELVAKLARNG